MGSRPPTGISTAHNSSFQLLTNSVMSGLTKSTSPVPVLAAGTAAVTRDFVYPLAGLDFQNNSLAFSKPDTSYGHQSSPLEILENLSLLASGSAMGASSSDMLASLSNSVPLTMSTTASLATPVPSAPIVYPPKAQIRRQKMIYHCKFGEFGILEGQFTEPSGVAVTEDNEIIVADTNNHRIQVFDKEGNFKFQFGEVGKRDGQLLYPNRVAVVAASGIIVVECKVMRVVIFDMMGNVLNKFSCSRYLEFPNGVVVNDQMEIFISDNRAHCVKVFDYQGNYLR